MGQSRAFEPRIELGRPGLRDGAVVGRGIEVGAQRQFFDIDIEAPVAVDHVIESHLERGAERIVEFEARDRQPIIGPVFGD